MPTNLQGSVLLESFGMMGKLDSGFSAVEIRVLSSLFDSSSEGEKTGDRAACRNLTRFASRERGARLRKLIGANRGAENG